VWLLGNFACAGVDKWIRSIDPWPDASDFERVERRSREKLVDAQVALCETLVDAVAKEDF
jgi:hypothetical protein